MWAMLLPMGHRYAMDHVGAWLRATLSLGLLVVICHPLSALAVGVDYEAAIKPLLRKRCYACHGALKQKADLRLDTVASMIAAKVIVPGDPSPSVLIERVTTGDLDERMPPEHEGEALTDEEVRMVRDWITAGAPAPSDEQPESDPESHWAFQPIVRPDVPGSSDPAWFRNPIDAFIAKGHEARQLKPQGEASRLLLLRRLYVDLLGILPDGQAIADYQNDKEPDWYAGTVNRLLEDKRHGERWARHWMDIWRYSDWWGLGEQLRNSQNHIWHWRDWIVESLNDDIPYDEMVRQMLAADELYPTDLSKLRATGFLARNYFLFNRTQWLEETVEHVGKAFLGLTMNCAKCHDHKYDPIAQEDFYRMRAFFEPYHVRTDAVPGEHDLAKNGIPRAFDALLDLPTYRYIRGEEKHPDTSTIMAPGVPEILAFKDLDVKPISLPTEAWQPERRPWVFEAQFAAAKKQLDAAENDEDRAVAEANLDSVHARVAATRAYWDGPDDASRRVAVQAERHLALAQAQRTASLAEPDKDPLKKAREALKKAEAMASAPIEETDRFTPIVGAIWSATRFLDSTKDDSQITFPSQSTGRRSALANWIIDPRHPLTARVAVNHLWARHFGKPLVANVFDFGRNGAKPTHPELLDWLAAELIENQWSMKHLHRLLVNSATYRMQSSLIDVETQREQDPDNLSWWRREPIRLESQVIRDSILSLAGTLDATMGGPSVPVSEQESSSRRSLYFFHSNNERNLFLTMFDEALVTDCYRREQSIVPQQALALSNSTLVLDAASKIAMTLTGGRDFDDRTFISKAFNAILSISPNADEIATSQQALADWQALPDASAVSAHTHLVWALINHNDFVTLR
jgi:hypothetical protein